VRAAWGAAMRKPLATLALLAAASGAAYLGYLQLTTPATLEGCETRYMSACMAQRSHECEYESACVVAASVGCEARAATRCAAWRNGQ
jgi:hypothetical protein